MSSSKNPKLSSIFFQATNHPSGSMQGNVLVYLIVLILIFGVLGVTIISLFTTATSSSATPNNARRAYYIAESGVRFATSRIKAARFQQGYISEINTTAQYTLANGDSFAIDIFSPWFISTTAQNAATDNPFTLEVPNDGKIPGDFSIPDSNVFLVNWDTFSGSPPSNPPPIDSYAEITASSAAAEATSLTITMGSTPVLAVEAGQTVCLAVRPTDADLSSPLQAGEDIYIAAEARNFFPPRNGAIRIVTADNQAGEYYYEELVDETTRVRLTNLAPMLQSGFAEIANFSTDDWVVLSRYNYRVMVSGTSGDVTSEIGLAKQVWIFPTAYQWTIFEREFIESAVPNVTDAGVISTSTGATEDYDQIQLGDDADTDAGFGTIWYGGDKAIEGDSDHCQAGRCLFDKGIRVFFTLDYSGDGEGFVFALINGTDNTSDSAGGDAERSELLGYAGDSRQNSSGTLFLDGSLNGEGLLPPKMGIEFDTRTNYNKGFEQTLKYCDASSLKPDTRNDPQPGGNDEDAVQYIFWGSESFGAGLNPSIACRDNDATYDDNKHDADDIFEKWRFNTGGNVYSSPAIDTNVTEGIYGRVYVGSESKFIYGLNPADRLADSTEQTLTANEWKINTGGTLESNATIGDDGMVYIGAHGGAGEGLVFAINPASRLAGESFPDPIGNEWRFSNATIGGHSNIWTSPAIDYNGTRGDTSDDTIYIGDDDGVFYAFSPHSATPKWWLKPVDFGFNFKQSSADRPALANYNGRKRVYITGRESNDKTLFALDPADRNAEYDNPGSNPFPNLTDGHEWAFNIGNPSYSMPGVDPGNGRIYSAGEGNRMVALSPTGAEVWDSAVYNLNSTTYSTPVTDDDGVIYVLPWDGKLHAVNANGTQKWTFQSGGNADTSNPAIGPDGTVYFGSKDGRLYAVGHDGVSATGIQKYNFNTGDVIYTTPAIDPRDETVYIGSDSDYLHAINQLAEPRSYRDESVENQKMISSEDFSGITFANTDNWLQGPNVDGAPVGTWAVRSEVTYDGQVGDQYQYRLKTWFEKCTEAGCSKFLNSNFRDTQKNYKVSTRPPKLDQIITLTADEHAKFERFLFGFTSAAASGDTQTAIIKFFELTFIRATDPDVTFDPNLDS